MNDLHHFHFVELVLAYHAAGIAPAAPGLGTETRSMRGQLHGQIGLSHNRVAHRSRQCYFRCRDQVEIFRGNQITLIITLRLVVLAALGHPKHVILELG